MKKPIKPGDFFLLPFRGRRIDLLIEAISPALYGSSSSYWLTRHAYGGTPFVTLLSSCHRCPPSLAKKIIGAHHVNRKS